LLLGVSIDEVDERDDEEEPGRKRTTTVAGVLDASKQKRDEPDDEFHPGKRPNKSVKRAAPDRVGNLGKGKEKKVERKVSEAVTRRILTEIAKKSVPTFGGHLAGKSHLLTV